jgi:predicted transcriptional regulator
MPIAVGSNAHNPGKERVGSLLNKHRPKISPGDETRQAAKVMLRNGTRELPVVQNGKLLGLLKFDDIARESPALIAMLSARLLTLRHRPKGSTFPAGTNM